VNVFRIPVLLRKLGLSPGLVDNPLFAPLVKGVVMQAYKKALLTVLKIKYRSDPVEYLNVDGAVFRFYDPGFSYLALNFTGNAHEPAVTRHLKFLISHGSHCFLDIGAYYGYFALFAAAAGDGCDVHAFEPNSEYFSIVEKNAALNGFNIRCHRLALSGSSGSIPFYDRSMKAGHGVCEYVQSISFDELSEREDIRPDIVKIDVHGSEGKVLSGMERALEKHIGHIFIELHPDDVMVDCSVKSVVDLLKQSGFRLFEMDGFRHRQRPLYRELDAALYRSLVDMNQWSDQHVRDRRMFYAAREPVFP